MGLTLEDKFERVEKLRPIDDILFEVLVEDIKVCEEILRVVLEDEKLVVESVEPQKSIRNLIGRSVRVDALCVLGSGKRCNIEVQRSDVNHFKRIRYNSSCITATVIETGTEFEKVALETGDVIEDGLEIVCVNTKIDDGSDVAEYMKLFMQSKIENTKFKELTRRMKYMKESEGGRGKMCEIMEEYAKEYVDEIKQKQILAGLKEGIAPDILAKVINVSVEEVLRVKQENVELV